MLCKYEFDCEGSCPNDPSLKNRYHVTVTARTMIQIEDLLRGVAEITREPIFQENFTARLAQMFQAKVDTTGEHSGVKTWTECAGY